LRSAERVPPQPQLGGHAQTSPPHAPPHEQRVPLARSAGVSHEAQAHAEHGAHEQEVVAVAVMGILGGRGWRPDAPVHPGADPRERGRRSS
jgi:hypothetical protein